MGRRKIIEDADLLRHAREVFLTHGAFGSTKDIAKSAGISEAALFQRYPTKADLFLAAMMPPEIDIAAIMAPAKALTDPRRALTAICEEMLAYFRRVVPNVLHLMTHPAIRIDDVLAHFKKQPVPALVDAIASYLRAARARGLVELDDPLAAAGLLVSSVHSLAVFELLGMHGGKFPQAAIKNLVAALWRGLTPKEPKARKGRKGKP